VHAGTPDTSDGWPSFQNAENGCPPPLRPAPAERCSEIIEQFRREQTDRDMVFDYRLVSAGPEGNRAPSNRMWRDGEVLSLDSGGVYQGYIAPPLGRRRPG